MHKWIGRLPTACDVCGNPPDPYFVDGATRPTGTWGLLCPECHKERGCGFGIGKGQAYSMKNGARLMPEEEGATVLKLM